ncbi:hypothetical protein HY489_01850 [Candidatus Woesearchaeota archaeon]|nr:hypothetical protein [Candidatus Woesearchaeota archaeon]
MLDWLVKEVFRRSLLDTKFFRRVVRPAAYVLGRNDPERVHELALELLARYENVAREAAFDDPDLHVEVAGKQVMPFGSSAGLDKNGDALLPLSYLFGFLVPGTVVVEPRPGNPRPRVAVDEKNGEVYNAQGFPHKGLNHFLGNVRRYCRRGSAPLLVSVCGIPPSADRIDVSFRELEKLVDVLSPFVDGFVWNPYSPNTAALKALRDPGVFRESAELFEERAGGKLNLVKMGPYEESQRDEWLGLVDAWMQSGDGVVAVNTYPTPKERVPAKEWGYPSAGRSGRFLQGYRQRAVRDVRAAFPNAFIAAAGGIDSWQQAWAAFDAGANVLKGYTPYTFQGFGLLKQLAKGVKAELKRQGYASLEEFQRNRGYC